SPPVDDRTRRGWLWRQELPGLDALLLPHPTGGPHASDLPLTGPGPPCLQLRAPRRPCSRGAGKVTTLPSTDPGPLAHGRGDVPDCPNSLTLRRCRPDRLTPCAGPDSR